MRRRRPKTKSPEEIKRRKKEYQRKYYAANREKFKEYQREYNRKHRKTPGRNGKLGRRPGFIQVREQRITAVNHSQLMHSPAEKTIKLINGIIKGEIVFTL